MFFVNVVLNFDFTVYFGAGAFIILYVLYIRYCTMFMFIPILRTYSTTFLYHASRISALRMYDVLYYNL